MFPSTKITGALAAIALFTAGCSTAPGSQPLVSPQAVGAVVGGVAGGVAGAQFGKGNGRLAATIAGTLLGGVVGSAIAARLSEQGRVAATNTTQQALSTSPTGQAVRWDDPQTGIYGTVQPTSNVYYVPTGEYNAQTYGGTYGQQQVPQQAYAQAPQPVYRQPGQQVYAQQQPQAFGTSQGIECRDYQTAVFSNGQPETLTGTMCRTAPNQPWRPRT